MQTKLSSLIEAVVSTAIGFIVSMLTLQLIVNPLWGLQLSVLDNFGITCLFTAISVVRQYVMRRYFNRRIVNAIRTATR
jgi:hypothetical protein